ncbi:MAG: hypothetical protein ACXWIX_09365, partial [Croceibacterium sp.]
MRRITSYRLAVTASALAAAAMLFTGPSGAVAQQAPASMPAAGATAAKAAAPAKAKVPVKEWKTPADLSVLLPVDTTYTPPRTQWGDYDFAHTYQIENLNAG